MRQQLDSAQILTASPVSNLQRGIPSLVSSDWTILITVERISIQIPAVEVTIALMITEIVVGIAFLCIRSERHRVDHEHGMVHAYKDWLKRKLKRNGHVI